MVQSARDFVALHTQLMDELPTFLEGYSRIFDMTLAAFAKVQATYYAGVRVRLEEFTKRWIARPRKTPRINLNPADKQHDLSTGKGIVKEWHSTWGPNADAMENFNITRSCEWTMVFGVAVMFADWDSSERTYALNLVQQSTRI